MVSGSDSVWQLSLLLKTVFLVVVTSQVPLAARPGRVLVWCTGDNQPSLAGPGHVIGLNFMMQLIL